jgi:thioredoxin reductase (NADPH)
MPSVTSALTTDVAIIGAGPVGLFAVFEVGMLKLSAVLIDALTDIGGQCSALYPEKPIYDIPGHPTIEAGELVAKLEAQIAPFAPPRLLGRRVEALSGGPGDFRLTTDLGDDIRAKAVIVAAGAGAFGPNRPPLDGLAAYEASGAVQYHVRRREELRGKRVVIAGGGDSAVDWALALKDIAQVVVVHRRAKFRAAPETADQLDAAAARGEVEMIIPYQLHALHGADGKLASVEVATLRGETRQLFADILLPFFGLSMDLGPIAVWGLDREGAHIRIDPSTCQTSLPGVFAIGDVAAYPGKLKLILQGFSEAAMAAHAIFPLARPNEALHFEYSTTKGVPART